ncbi:nucleotide exchange factor GrpE [Lignipirellula cremea]|uniref:Protein GrpE n=1 Tax=Lignipirellula cremea TaxID=2528010 RepID=A0A518E3R9_9BACT|nr:nucleotide exchange factor GrpE [Lignipirellula cremea]QDU98740.1 Protein GrpE [Lignipirellula cremea]
MTRSPWENEQILQQFGDWLTETAGEAAAAGEPNDPPPALPAVGLLQVVEALTAMRQELKLQTKSSRGLEDSLQQARQGLDEAIRQFQSVKPREEESARQASLPLVEAIVGLDESLWRAGKALEATHRRLAEVVPQRLQATVARELAQLSWWRRRLLGSGLLQIERQCAATVADVAEEELGAFLQGHQLMQERMRQELARHGIQRLETLGLKVDPHGMRVVALADPQAGPPETVVEEIRPGYTWGKRVVRIAEVKAVASRPAGTSAGDASSSPQV